mgnify:FL=1
MPNLKIIDRYILWQFISILFICFFSLTGLYIVFDAFSNLDSFMESAEKEGSLLKVMGTFYFFKSIVFFDLTSGVLCLIASMFTLTWLQRHNEMTALMAAGISRFRVALPIIITVCVISFLSAANRELILPHYREELARNAKDLLGEATQELKPRYDNKTDILLRGEFTVAAERRITNPDFLLPTGMDRYGRQIRARDAFYRPAEGDRPSGYLLQGVTEPLELLKQPSIYDQGGEKTILTPYDYDWLQPDEVFVVSDIDFEQLTGGRGFLQFSSTKELLDSLRNESLDFGASVRVNVHSRLVRPLLDINLLFLGLPLVLRRDNRNVFVAVGLCLAVVTIFLLTVYGARFLGSAVVLSPHLSAWLPLLIFVPVAVAMSDPLRQ